jgi:hypothetical protein
MTMTRLVAVGIAALLSATPARGQRPDVSFAAWGSGITVRSLYPGGAERLAGSILGGEGAIRWRRLSLRVLYGEGSVKPDTAGPADRDVVDGLVLLGASPVAGLDLMVGPQARAYVTGAGTQRWLFWVLRARYEASVLAPLIKGYAEAWAAVSGSVSVSEAYDSDRGGAAGLVVRPGDGRFSVRLAYAVEETRLGSGARRETIEGVSIALGYGRR